MKFFSTIALAALLISDLAGGASCRRNGASYMFVFGDSYTTTNFDIHGAQPTPSNPTGNQDLGDHNTSANGPVWVNFLTTKYNTTPLLTYNFAVGGAAIPDNFTFQIQHMYQPKYTTNPFWKGSNTLHATWIGINDVSNAWLTSNNTLARPDDAKIAESMSVLGLRLNELYDTGARNFLLANVPPVDRSPFIVSQGNVTERNYRSYVQLFNTKLGTVIDNFRKNHPLVTVKLYDVHTFFADVLDHPTKYGFKDNSCIDEKGCLWAGWFHILSSFHDVIAKDMATEIAKFNFS